MLERQGWSVRSYVQGQEPLWKVIWLFYVPGLAAGAAVSALVFAFWMGTDLGFQILIWLTPTPYPMAPMVLAASCLPPFVLALCCGTLAVWRCARNAETKLFGTVARLLVATLAVALLLRMGRATAKFVIGW